MPGAFRPLPPDAFMPITPTPAPTRAPARTARLGDGARYRIGVASRAVAAIAGGYAVAALATAALALFLPLPRSEAALTGTLLSFAVYTGAVLWSFAARTAWRAWRGLLGAALVPGLPLAASRFFGG